MNLELLLNVSGLTLAGVCIYMGATRSFHLNPGALRKSLSQITQCIGTMVVALGINFCFCYFVLFVWRAAISTFVSIYAVDPVLLCFFSVIEGMLFYFWKLDKDLKLSQR